MANELAIAIQDTEAMVNVTYAGKNGNLSEPVSKDASDADIKSWVEEALRGGSIPGIEAQANADLVDFVVDRFGPSEVRPYALLQVRPKTPFGDAPTSYTHPQDSQVYCEVTPIKGTTFPPVRAMSDGLVACGKNTGKLGVLTHWNAVVFHLRWALERSPEMRRDVQKMLDECAAKAELDKALAG